MSKFFCEANFNIVLFYIFPFLIKQKIMCQEARENLLAHYHII